MRVLYFHQHFSTPEGTGGTRSYEMARRLVERGHSVTIVCGSNVRGATGVEGPMRRGIRSGTVDGIRVIEIDVTYSNHQGLLRRSAGFARFALRGIRIALREPHDVLFATSTPLTAGIPGIAASWLRRRRFVFEVRDLWPELPRAMGVVRNPVVLAALGALEWASYRAARICVGLSPGIVDGIRRRGRRGLEVALIPNGSELSLFRPRADKRIELPGILPGDFVCLFAGAHGRANGLGSVLDAAEELERRGERHIKFLLIGDGSEKPALVERVRTSGLTNCVFHDLLPKRRLAEIVPAAHVGLMVLADVPAFYFGTSPNKFFDYLAAGLPVLNNYPGWLAELIAEHRCGIAVPPGDPRKFADALLALRDDTAGRDQMGENARRLAQENFDRRMLADRLVDLLERVAAE